MVAALETTARPFEHDKIGATVSRVVGAFCERQKTANLASTRALLGIATTFALLREPQLSDGALLAQLNRFAPLIQQEFDFYQDPNRLSIGAEVEVGHDNYFPMSTNKTYSELGDLLTACGVIVKREGIKKTEFEFPPCNSPALLNAMISEFRNEGFIPDDVSEFNALHVNVGIPLKSALKEVDGQLEEEEYTRANTIALLLALGYSSVGRIKNGNFQFPFELRKVAKTGEQLVPSIKYGEEGEWCERFEIRCLKVSTETGTLQLLEHAQILGLLLTDEYKADKIWIATWPYITAFLKEEGIDKKVLFDVDLRAKLANLLVEDARRKRRVIRSKAQNFVDAMTSELSQLLAA